MRTQVQESPSEKMAFELILGAGESLSHESLFGSSILSGGTASVDDLNTEKQAYSPGAPNIFPAVYFPSFASCIFRILPLRTFWLLKTESSVNFLSYGSGFQVRIRKSLDFESPCYFMAQDGLCLSMVLNNHKMSIVEHNKENFLLIPSVQGRRAQPPFIQVTNNQMHHSCCVRRGCSKLHTGPHRHLLTFHWLGLHLSSRWGAVPLQVCLAGEGTVCEQSMRVIRPPRSTQGEEAFL